MSAPLVCSLEDDDALETLRTMRFRGVRRVPVVDGDGWLTGIATLDDLLELAGETLNDVVGAITSERSLEGLRRR
jgi:CBS domain-containing protein